MSGKKTPPTLAAKLQRLADEREKRMRQGAQTLARAKAKNGGGKEVEVTARADAARPALLLATQGLWEAQLRVGHPAERVKIDFGRRNYMVTFAGVAPCHREPMIAAVRDGFRSHDGWRVPDVQRWTQGSTGEVGFTVYVNLPGRKK